MARKAGTVIGAAIVLFGIGVYLYPNIREWQLEVRTQKLIAEFNEKYDTAVSEKAGREEDDAESSFSDLYDEMLAYNEGLAENGQQIVDAWSYAQEPIDLSSLSDEGAVGYIQIPAMDMTLPLYVGATTEHLADGAAVLSETSMPIGGENTNCVIAGHRGYSGMPYFREIEKLQAGDLVYITNPWGTITYAVTATCIIEPDDVESILIQPGKDMVTLLTCHPYMSSGEFRYVVYCERVDADTPSLANTEEELPSSLHGKTAESSKMVIWIEKVIRYTVPILFFVIFLFALFARKGRKRGYPRTHKTDKK